MSNKTLVQVHHEDTRIHGNMTCDSPKGDTIAFTIKQWHRHSVAQ